MKKLILIIVSFLIITICLITETNKKEECEWVDTIVGYRETDDYHGEGICLNEYRRR